MKQTKNVIEPAQLAEDIRDLAQSLLDSPETGDIIRRAGAHRNFTPQESEIVYGFAVEANCFEAFGNLGLQHACIVANIDVAIGVARRVAEGEFAATNSEDAENLIRDNIVCTQNLQEEIKERKIEFDCFHKILIEYFDENPDIAQNINRWEEGEYSDDPRTERQKSVDALNKPGFLIMRRYGLVLGIQLAHLAFRIIRNNVDYRDPEQVLNAARGLNEKYLHISGMDHD